MGAGCGVSFYFLSSLLMLCRAQELQGEGKIVGGVSDTVFGFRKETKKKANFKTILKLN